MAITYSVEPRGQYVYFAGQGVEESLDEDLRIHDFIVRTCKENNCRRALIDDRNVVYTASILSIYELVKRYAQEEMPPYIERAALLANPEFHEDNQFFENVAQNRAINLRVFHDMESAVRWLTT
jgi:hypothetical protein